MQDNSAKSRSFNSMSVPGLSDEARQTVNVAFDAMSAWRIETAKSNEKNSERVIEKMAAAARALGWPEQIVDATRAQLQSITKMQIQMMDHMMHVWEEQIEKPRLPKKTGPELDSVRPLKSPVSPSAPTRPVAFGSAP